MPGSESALALENHTGCRVDPIERLYESPAMRQPGGSSCGGYRHRRSIKELLRPAAAGLRQGVMTPIHQDMVAGGRLNQTFPSVSRVHHPSHP
jgi:hypothetical protein